MRPQLRPLLLEAWSSAPADGMKAMMAEAYVNACYGMLCQGADGVVEELQQPLVDYGWVKGEDGGWSLDPSFAATVEGRTKLTAAANLVVRTYVRVFVSRKRPLEEPAAAEEDTTDQYVNLDPKLMEFLRGLGPEPAAMLGNAQLKKFPGAMEALAALNAGDIPAASGFPQASVQRLGGSTVW